MKNISEHICKLTNHRVKIKHYCVEKVCFANPKAIIREYVRT